MKSYLQNRLTGDISSVYNAIHTFNFSGALLVLFLACGYITLNAQPVIALEEIASGFEGPLDILHAGDERLFVVEQDGVIKIVDENGITLPTPFLDIDAQVNSSGNEQGLLGMAFHPNYIENGYFFVHYSKSNGDTRISRFSVSADDANIADPDSELIILEVVQPYSNHNGGCIKFGPDGYLYIGLGDGGSGGDPQGNGQNRLTFLAKMLRIDIDNGDPYSIPADNPFADEDSTLDEIWAIGLRNPWRFSFDRLMGDLWIGDVGQNEWEEIDFQSADSPGGENYGWRCFEGLEEYINSGDCPDESELTFPVSIYSNSFAEGCSITGGFVYRGDAFPSMYGYYFYTDYCSGKIWTTIQENDEWITTEVLDENTFGFSSFGEGVNGELYITDLSSGRIYHIIPDCPDYFISASLENETCAGDGNGSISVIDAATNFSILWSTGETTDTISNLTSGDYFVTLTNEGGCTYTKQFIITNSTPNAPIVFIENDNELSVNDSYETYQWYVNGEIIDGATAGSFTVEEQSGEYFVAVGSAEGCMTNSDTVQIDILGLETLGLTHFSIHPNPFVESINVEINAQESGNYIFSIQSLDGKVVYESEGQVDAFLQKNISLENVSTGTYLLILEKNNQQLVRKIIKQ